MNEPAGGLDPHSRALAALANPARRRLLNLLAETGPANVSELATRTGQAIGSASHHLRILAAANLIIHAPRPDSPGRDTRWQAAPSTHPATGRPTASAAAAAIAALAASIDAA